MRPKEQLRCVVHGVGACICLGARHWMDRALEAERLIAATAIHLQSNWRAIDGYFLFKLLDFQGKPADYALGGAAEPPAASRTSIQSVVAEMIEVAASGTDEVMDEWTADNRAQIDKWQVRLADAIGAEPPAEPRTEYTMNIGNAGEAYLKARGFDPKWLPGNFFWTELWDAMRGAAVTKSDCGACDKPDVHCANQYGICSRHGGMTLKQTDAPNDGEFAGVAAETPAVCATCNDRGEGK